MSQLLTLSTYEERKERAKKMVAYLKRAYPNPKTELIYATPIQLVVSVMLSAQCTDKKVNEVAQELHKKYRTIHDFATANWDTLTKETQGITFNRTKARHIIAMAKMLEERFDSKIPRTEAELIQLPGIAYKTAHVVLGELYDIWEGIPTDTHVRRFALRFDLTSNTELTRISKDLEALIPKKNWKYVNNGLVLYGRYVCPARPHPCDDHPLSRIWEPARTRWPKAK